MYAHIAHTALKLFEFLILDQLFFLNCANII